MSVNIQKQKAAKPELISDSKVWIILQSFFGGFINKGLILFYILSYIYVSQNSTLITSIYIIGITIAGMLLVYYKIEYLKKYNILHVLPDSLELRIRKVDSRQPPRYLPLIAIRNLQKKQRNFYSFQFAKNYTEQLETIEFYSYDGPKSYSFISLLMKDDQFNSSVYYLYEMVQYAKKKTTN